MKFSSQVVHAGDRKRKAGATVPSTTPIHLASTYFFDSAERLDRVLGDEEEGFCYSRYASPTNAALEELVTVLEGGHGTLATASGMAAVQMALQVALTDRNHSVVASDSIYGATIGLLDKVFEPFGVDVSYTDFCDLDQLSQVMEKRKPGAVFMESISNPLLRVPDLRRVAELSKAAGACLIVDNTFATPMLMRPLEHGAHIVVHSATKYLAGHGDVLGGLVVSDAEHHGQVRALSKLAGPVLGPFESYLTMRGIKTLALRFERQNQNARCLAEWLRGHPRVERVYYGAQADHPDAEAIRELFAPDLFGAILSFEIRGAAKQDVLRFMNALKMIVPGTSLGDVHTLVLYPLIASHRNVSPKMRARVGIRDNLVRVAAGIEELEDIRADLAQALDLANPVS